MFNCKYLKRSSNVCKVINSVYEAVIAMALMVIIIMAVTTIISSSILVNDKIRNEARASLLSNSVVEVYKDSRDNFSSNLSDIYQSVNIDDTKITLKENKITLKMDVKEGLSIIAYNEKNEEILRYYYGIQE